MTDKVDRASREALLDVLADVLDKPNTHYSPGVEAAKLEAAEILLIAEGADARADKAAAFLQSVAVGADGVISISSRVRAAKALLARRTL